MKCTLCKKPIEKYSIDFNYLLIDECNEINICLDCVDKVVKWQKNNLARLFPTKTAKKYLGK